MLEENDLGWTKEKDRKRTKKEYKIISPLNSSSSLDSPKKKS